MLKNPQLKEKEQQKQEQRRISFSELKTWNECAYKHKLVYIDKEPHFTGNAFTAFGTSIHSICEKMVLNKKSEPFADIFRMNLAELDSYDVKLVDAMYQAAEKILPQVLPALKKYFGKYEVVSVEEKLMQNIEDFNSYGKKFKGFIDLVLKTPDGKYHIIDWKTCSWGWDARKRSDKMINYQLSFYKKFFSLKHGIEPSKIETYFGLLKRTAAKDNVEIFKVSSGDKRVQNATLLLEKAIININNGVDIKNKLSCRYCFFSERCNGVKL